MASLTCPNCKKHISVFDLTCFSCGFTITVEERDSQLKELEKQMNDDSLKGSSPQEKALKHQKEQKILKKLNRFSFGLFKFGWGEVVVPTIIVVILIIVIVLMTI